MNNYFNNKKEKKEEKDKWIIWRKNKRMQSPYIYFNRGDIIAITLWIKRYKFRFEGICLGYKNKGFKNPEMTIILRNVIEKVGVEILSSYFYNRLYLNTAILEYRRKALWYKPAKIKFLRNRENQATRI